MERLESERQLVPAPEAWEPRYEIPIQKEFFQLQFEFAKLVAERRNLLLDTAVISYAPFIRNNAFKRNEDSAERVPHEDVTEETMADIAYENYLKQVRPDVIPYHEGTRFGCFFHTYNAHNRVAELHFVNAEYDVKGPLDASKLGSRRREVTDVLKNIRDMHPHVRSITGDSWLYNLEAYRRILPARYTSNAEPSEKWGEWARGTTIWGQFLDSEGGAKQDLGAILLERAKELGPETPLHELLRAPLMRPLIVAADIADFYTEYDIDH